MSVSLLLAGLISGSSLVVAMVSSVISGIVERPIERERADEPDDGVIIGE
jgi:hypothetical protein